MTISAHLAISNSMSSFVPKYWLNWQILVAILMNFVDKDGTTKVYIPVHPWTFDSLFCPEGSAFVHNDCPGEGFLLPSSCVLGGGVVMDEIDTCILN